MGGGATLNAPADSASTKDFVETLFLQHQSQLFHFLVRTLGYGHREDAEDLLLEVFLRAQKSLNAGTSIAKEATTSWLYTIAKHAACDFLRRRQLIAWTPLSAFTLPEQALHSEIREEALYQNSHAVWYASSYGSGFEERIINQELIQTIFQQLPPKYAICLWMFEYEGFSCPEIAERLNISPSAVKMRLIRARRLAEQKMSQLDECERA